MTTAKQLAARPEAIPVYIHMPSANAAHASPWPNMLQAISHSCSRPPPVCHQGHRQRRCSVDLLAGCAWFCTLLLLRLAACTGSHAQLYQQAYMVHAYMHTYVKPQQRRSASSSYRIFICTLPGSTMLTAPHCPAINTWRNTTVSSLPPGPCQQPPDQYCHQHHTFSCQGPPANTTTGPQGPCC